jgi:hypothetical protein
MRCGADYANKTEAQFYGGLETGEDDGQLRQNSEKM